MALSVFDLFKIGIGPSSSHTVGPMWAALCSRKHWTTPASSIALKRVPRRSVRLAGSDRTRTRHRSRRPAGLSGERPDTVDPDIVEPLAARVRPQHRLRLAGQCDIVF